MRSDDHKAKILHVMYKRNRPGNVATVEAFTGHKIPKGIVQNSLEELVKSGELKAKDSNGKNRIYWFNQDLFRLKSLDLGGMAAGIEDSNSRLRSLQEESSELSKALSSLLSQPADSELGDVIQNLVAK